MQQRSMVYYDVKPDGLVLKKKIDEAYKKGWCVHQIIPHQMVGAITEKAVEWGLKMSTDHKQYQHVDCYIVIYRKDEDSPFEE